MDAEIEIIEGVSPDRVEAASPTPTPTQTPTPGPTMVRAGVPGTLTTHRPAPARSTGNSGRGRGYVPTVTTVHGGTTSLHVLATTEM